MKKSLKLRELLRFYDYRVQNSITHATAINSVMGEDLGVALLEHYFKTRGFDVNSLDEPCTQKKKKGYRLDKWITVTTNAKSILYQVEIKNWSAHSIGGDAVMQDSDETYMSAFRRKRWQRQFNETSKIPSQESSKKVLTKMLAPSNFENFEHRAILCFWEPLHPSGELEAFFEVDVQSESFSKLGVFSMSNYVSLLLKTCETLEVDLPNADERIAWLDRMYG